MQVQAARDRSLARLLPGENPRLQWLLLATSGRLSQTRTKNNLRRPLKLPASRPHTAAILLQLHHNPTFVALLLGIRCAIYIQQISGYSQPANKLHTARPCCREKKYLNAQLGSAFPTHVRTCPNHRTFPHDSHAG